MEHIIISAFGPDEPGIVSNLSGVITNSGANIKESRMIKLGTDFTIMILISISENNSKSLEAALKKIDYLIIHTKKTFLQKLSPKTSEYVLNLSGADNEGLVHNITENISKKGINIEEMDTKIENAPMSGTILFNMNARLSHPNLDLNHFQNEMTILADKLNVEIVVTSKR